MVTNKIILINGWIGTILYSFNVLSRQVTVCGYVDGSVATNDVIFQFAANSTDSILTSVLPVTKGAISLFAFDKSNDRVIEIPIVSVNNNFYAKTDSRNVLYFTISYIAEL